MTKHQHVIFKLCLVSGLLFVARFSAVAEDKTALPTGKRSSEQHLRGSMKFLNDLRSGRIKPIKFNFAPIEIEGTVVDAWSYATGETPTAGSSEADKRNVCLAIVDGQGQIFVAAKGKPPYLGCDLVLSPLLGQKVKVKGFVSRRGGSNILKATEVQRL